MARIGKILVAGRGEIACRVMRTAHAQGIKTVAVYSQADTEAPHVAMADEAVLIGPGPAGQSYLVVEKILQAARDSGADAIHPGYGFLSENAAFADAVEQTGLIFVGPTGASIDLMGNKAAAKRQMIAAGVPCVPGYEGEDQSDAVLLAEGKKIGFPLMVKPAAGGGGRGIRLVTAATDLAAAVNTTRSEAENAFGSGYLILEKAIIRPRHIEIQVFADTHGTVVHLGERDCSVQRRHQKVIEEAPSPVITPALREVMGRAAVDAARTINYRGAGTVEFLFDGDGQFYFIEMNTRLQVEHPVTEEVTGLDLVALQIKVAEGQPLGLKQDDIALRGHAIEVRLYAEDPANGFLPSTGRIEMFAQSTRPGVRYDTGIVAGQEISPFYDPMLAKLITYGDSRATARKLMVEALRETAVFGPRTNRDFLIACLENNSFADGDFSTAFIAEQFGEDGFADGEVNAIVVAAMAVRYFLFDRARAVVCALNTPARLLNFTAGEVLRSPYRLEIGDAVYDVAVKTRADGQFQVVHGDEHIEVIVGKQDGAQITLLVNGKPCMTHACQACEQLYLNLGSRSYVGSNLLARNVVGDEAGDGRNVLAPMHGRVVEVFVAVGDIIAAGDRLVIIEAMKMQHEILAQIDGTVTELLAAVDQQVAADDLMISIDIEDG